MLPKEGKLWGVGFFAQGVNLKTFGKNVTAPKGLCCHYTAG